MSRKRMVMHQTLGLCEVEGMGVSDGKLSVYHIKPIQPNAVNHVTRSYGATVVKVTSDALVKPDNMSDVAEDIFGMFCRVVPSVAWTEISEGSWSIVVKGYVSVNGELASVRASVPLAQYERSLVDAYIRAVVEGSIARSVGSLIVGGKQDVRKRKQ